MLFGRTCKRAWFLVFAVISSRVVHAQVVDASLCNEEVNSACAGGFVGSILERPVGIIDGRNALFSTHRVPSSEVPIRVYRNGLPLTNELDYRTAGQKLIFSSSEIPQLGDVLEVEYIPSSAGQSQFGIPGTESFSNNLSIPFAVQVAKAASKAALQMEEQSAARHKDTRTEKVLSLPDQSFGSKQRNPPESLRMLSSQLGFSEGSNRVGSGAEMRDAETLQGIDGLGDGPAMVGLGDGYYRSESTDVFPSKHRQSVSASQSHSSAAASSDSSSSAIKMLEKRVHPEDVRQTTSSTF